MLAEIVNISNKIRQKLFTADIIRPKFESYVYDTLDVSFIHHDQVQLNDGNIYICGGKNESGNILNSAYIYDVKSKTLEAVRPLPKALYGHAINPLPDGNVLITCGFSDDGDSGDIYVYDVKHDVYEKVVVSSTPGGYHDAVYTSSNVVTMFSKYSINNQDVFTFAESINIDTFTLSSDIVYYPIYGYSGDSYISDKYNIYSLFGGFYPDTNSAQTYTYTMIDGSLSSSGYASGIPARYFHKVIIVLSGRYILHIGGSAPSFNGVNDAISVIDSYKNTSVDDFTIYMCKKLWKFSASKYNNSSSILVTGGMDDLGAFNYDIVAIDIKL